MIGQRLDLVFEGANRVLMLGNGLGMGLDVLLLVTNRRLETNTLIFLVLESGLQRGLKNANKRCCTSVNQPSDLVVVTTHFFWIVVLS